MDFFSNGIFVGISACTGRMRILLSLLPIVIIGLGAKHFFDCPKQPMIPIYLLVGGLACLSLQIFPFFYCSQSDESCFPLRIFHYLLFLFCAVWLIIGSVFVYTAYKPNYNSHRSVEYCEKTLYEVAFWITNALYVFALFILLGCSCTWLISRISEKNFKCFRPCDSE